MAAIRPKPDLAFVVTNPRFFGIEYAFSLPDSVSERLGIHSSEEVLVLTIVNIPKGNPEQMTANLLGPLVVNEKTLQAMQVVLNNTEYSTKTRLLDDNAGTVAGVSSTASPGALSHAGTDAQGRPETDDWRRSGGYHFGKLTW